jgi:phage gp29-like protein
VTFKRGGWKFWIKFAEKYGAVWPVGKLPRSATPGQRDELLDTLERMIQDGVAVIPDDGSAEFLEAGDKSATSSLFESIIGKADSAISTVWLGHAGAGESVQGELGGGKGVAVDVRDDLRDDDANLITQTLQQVIDWTIEVNWPGSESPRFELKEKEEIDTTQAERDDKLSTAMEKSDLKLTRVYFQKTYGLDEEDIEEKSGTTEPVVPEVSGPQFSEGSSGQVAVDAFIASFSAEDLQSNVKDVLLPLISDLRQRGDYAEAMEKLTDSFPWMDTGALQDVLTKMIFISEMAGRLDARR